MDNYKQYRRSQIAELADWCDGFDMTGVSISEADKQAGSPKIGDKIARNPKNHADRWLVAADYFTANFEPVGDTSSELAALQAQMAELKRANSDLAAAAIVPDNMVLVPRELIDRFPEINPSNYNHDDACALNEWGIEVVLAAKEVGK